MTIREGGDDVSLEEDVSVGVKAAADGPGVGPQAVGNIQEGEVVIAKGGGCVGHCGTATAVLADGRCLVVVLPDLREGKGADHGGGQRACHRQAVVVGP